MHLGMYKRDPSNHWIKECFEVQESHICMISFNFFVGIDMVRALLSINMPKHVTAVAGGTNFSELISKPNCGNKLSKN